MEKDYTLTAQDIAEMPPTDWALYYATQLDKYDSRVEFNDAMFGAKFLCFNDEAHNYRYTGAEIYVEIGGVWHNVEFHYNIETGYIRALHRDEDSGEWISPPCSASAIMSFVWKEIGVDPAYLETCEDGDDEEELRGI